MGWLETVAAMAVPIAYFEWRVRTARRPKPVDKPRKPMGFL